LSGAFGIREMS